MTTNITSAPFFPELGRYLGGKFGIAGQQLSPIYATCLEYVEFSLADPQALANRQG
jgi:hypothetical protein